MTSIKENISPKIIMFSYPPYLYDLYSKMENICVKLENNLKDDIHHNLLKNEFN